MLIFNNAFSLPFTKHLQIFLTFKKSLKKFGLYFIVCFTSFDKGYGHMMHQLRRLEMQPYIVALKFCHLTGNANQTAWYVI
jgi:hypothetical protein